MYNKFHSLSVILLAVLNKDPLLHYDVKSTINSIQYVVNFSLYVYNKLF
jgi:hypothetical protein